jgi:hypothetical protein
MSQQLTRHQYAPVYVGYSKPKISLGIRLVIQMTVSPQMSQDEYLLGCLPVQDRLDYCPSVGSNESSTPLSHPKICLNN